MSSTSTTDPESQLEALRANRRRYHESVAHPPPLVSPVVEILGNAIVVPQRHIHRNDFGVTIHDSGAYRSDGRLCELARHVAGFSDFDNLPRPTIDAGVTVTDTRSGTHLYGGALVYHFGHFLVESLSRLWALIEYGGQIETVVFVRAWGPFGDGLPAFMTDTLSLLGAQRLTIIDDDPVRFETLIVPAQLLGCHLISGHEAFHRFVHRLRKIRTQHSAPMGGTGSVYVSRRKFCESGGGSFVCEDVIEENLRNYGYDVIYPEELTVEQQLDVYNRCERLVFAKGSALHLFALVAREDQNVLIVSRRNNRDDVVPLQLRSFGAPLVKQCQVVKKQVYRDNVADPVAKFATSLSVLDFDALGTMLRARGFIPDKKRWRAPTEPELMAHLQKINQVTQTPGST